MSTLAAARSAEEPGMGTVEIFPIDTDEETLRGLLTEIFEQHWQTVQFGTMIQGSVFEIQAPQAPEHISMLDGYMTVDFGAWHFHVCIGEHRGSRANPCPPDLARHRRTARAELYRSLNGECAPNSWGLRLLNGKDEQQLTVFLPNPYIADDHKVTREADWSRLALWDDLRRRYLGLEPDDLDRTAKGFSHH